MKMMNDNREYLNSPEWKEKIERAKTTQPESYTFVYLDKDGEIHEKWLHISDEVIPNIFTKLELAGCEVLYCDIKTLPYGEVMKEILEQGEIVE